MPLLSFREFSELADHEPDGWLLDKLIPKAGITMLVGAATVGKSSFCSALNISIAAGLDFCGRKTTHGPVVYVPLEHGRKGIRNSHRKAAKPLGLDPADYPIHFYEIAGGFDPRNEEHLADLELCLNQIGAVLVVFDSCRAISSFDENDSKQVRELLKMFDRMTGNNTRAVIAIHHPNANGKPRGSTDWAAGSETILLLTRAELDSPELSLDARHHGAEPAEWLLLTDWSDESLTYTPLDKPEKASRGGRKAVPAPTKPPDLASAIRETLRRGKMSVRDHKKAVRDMGVKFANDAFRDEVQRQIDSGSLRLVDDNHALAL